MKDKGPQVSRCASLKQFMPVCASNIMIDRQCLLFLKCRSVICTLEEHWLLPCLMPASLPLTCTLHFRSQRVDSTEPTWQTPAAHVPLPTASHSLLPYRKLRVPRSLSPPC